MPEFDEVEKASTVAYGNIITLLSQQTQSKLESTITVKSGIRGKQAVAADQIGKFELYESNQRLEDTPMTDIDRDRRWYEYRVKKGGVPLDDIDTLRTTLDVKTPIVSAGMAGVNRAKDAEIIRAYYAACKTGENAENSVSFPSGNVIADTYASGDILKQINRAIELFKQGDVDYETEDITMIVNSLAATKLREAGVYINSETMSGTVLTSKKLVPYSGVNFVEFEAVPSYTSGQSTIYKLPIYCRSGMGLGKWQDVKVRVGELQAKSYAWHIYMQMALGGSRLEEAKCLSIEIK